jgi:hypothetical protein
MISRYVTLAATLLAISGCAPAWVNPTRDDAATLTFVPEATGYVHAYAFGNGKECRNKQAVSKFGGLKGETAIRVPPGEDFTALVSIADGNWTCNVAMTFTPQPRKAYAAVVSGGGRKCKMGIGHFEGTRLVVEPTARPRKWKAPFASNDEQQCE